MKEGEETTAMRGRICVRMLFHIFLYVTILGAFGFIWLYTPKRGDWMPIKQSMSVNIRNINVKLIYRS